MANYYYHDIPAQQLTINFLSENMRIILSDIFIIRDLNFIQCDTVYSDIYNTEYVIPNNTYLTNIVNRTIESFRDIILKKKGGSGSIIIKFYKYVDVKTWYNTNKREKVIWEKWKIPYQVVEHAEIDCVGLLNARQYIYSKAMVSIDAMPDDCIINFPLTPTPPTTPEMSPQSPPPLTLGEPAIKTHTSFGYVDALDTDTMLVNTSIKHTNPSFRFEITFLFGSDVNIFTNLVKSINLIKFN